MLEEKKDILEIGLGELEDYLHEFETENKFEWLIDISNTYFKNGNYKHSLICNKIIRELKPDFPPAYIQTASCLLKLNRSKEILEFIEQSEGKFVQKEHHQRHFRYLKAKALYDLNRIRQAKSILFPEIEDYEKKPPWFNNLEILILEKAGSYSQAIEHIDKKIKLYGNTAFYTRKKIEILSKAGRRSQAYDFVKQLTEEKPHDIDMLFYKGQMDYENGEFEQALSTYKSILELEDNYRAHLWVGNIYNIQKRKDLADLHLSKAFELAESDEDKMHCVNLILDFDSDSTIDSIISIWENKTGDSPKHLFYISKLKIKQTKYDEAEALLHRALDFEKNKKYYLDLARVASVKKEFDKADDILIRHELMEDAKLGLEARNEYCYNALRRGRYFVALQRFKEFSMLYPENFEIKAMIVNLYNQLSLFQKVVDYLDKEISDNPDNDEAWRVLISSYYQQQNYFKVLSTLSTFYEKFGKDERMMADHANSLREVGRYEDSQHILNEGLALFPESYLIQMSQAQLYRRLSSEFFFKRSEYHRKALETHLAIKCSRNNQLRSLRNEIITDLIQLRKFTDALHKIDEYLQENPGDAKLINMKIRVYSKMGNHNEALEYIDSLPENIQSDPEILTEKAAELLYLDKWDKCEKLLKRILKKSQTYQAFILKIRLDIRRGKFKKAKQTIRKLIQFSPHHAFILAEIIDFALTDPKVVLELYDHLGLDYNKLQGSLTILSPILSDESSDYITYKFCDVVSISHIILNGENLDFSPVQFSSDGVIWKNIKKGIYNVDFERQRIVLTGYFPLKYIKIPRAYKDIIEFYSVFALPTEIYNKTELGQSFKEKNFTMNIVETGLGDQLQYIRTAAVLAESLGMNFKGFMRSELEIIRDRVTSNPDLYKDLGFQNLLLEDDNYQLVKVPLSLQTRFVPALNQWPTFEKFLEYIKKQIEEKLSEIEADNGKETLIFLSIDDHNMTRLITKLYYPRYEPSSEAIKLIGKEFWTQQENRISQTSKTDKLSVLLQCRLGDVANIPFKYKDEDIWVIPFNGEVLKANDTNKHHMRYDNLETIKHIGQYLRKKYPDQIELKLITDGYDYGIEYLKDYQKLLVEEMGADEDSLNVLKKKLADGFYEEFDFVDEVVYGESYENLIQSIDLITNSNVLISTNGQFTNEFKMSFAKEDEEYMIVKKLYSNLRVKKSPKSTELFWEIEGQNMDKLLASISSYIDDHLSSRKKVP